MKEIDKRFYGRSSQLIPFNPREPIPENPPLQLRGLGTPIEASPFIRSIPETSGQASALPWHWRLEELNLRWEIEGLRVVLDEKIARLKEVSQSNLRRQALAIERSGRVVKVPVNASGRKPLVVSKDEIKASLAKEMGISLDSLNEFLATQHE